MRQVCSEILTDDVFRRSPKLSELLAYLVEKSITGEAGSLKSLTIAIEGLGRSSVSDDADSYARVQVGRLRKALAAYHAGRNGKDGLAIDPGGYVVRLVPPAASASSGIETSPPGDAAPRSEKRDWRSRDRTKRFALLALSLLFVVPAGLYLASMQRASATRWKTANFPNVSVEVHADSAAFTPERTKAIQEKLLHDVTKYEGLRTSLVSADAKGFAVQLSLYRQGGLSQSVIRLVDLRTERVVWSQLYEDFSFDDVNLDRLTSKAAFEIANPTGVLHAYNRRLGYEPDTPYGCWLRFTELAQSVRTIGDEQFEECASDWYANAPQHPVAAALYGWTLTDQSVTQPFESQRRAKLDEAISVLNRSRVINPTSVPLHIAAMRAHAFGGDQAEMRQAAREALALNPDSTLVQGMVGMFFSFWNDPQGERLLDQALEQDAHPPLWYHVGLAVADMMRDDPDAMLRHFRVLDEINQRQPMLEILFAAREARIGNLEKARSYLEGQNFQSAFGRARLSVVLERLPASPAVRRRVKEWLAPVM